MRSNALFLLLFLSTITAQAQQPGYRAFTVNDGLPSNHVYHCTEDNKGFLWVATDAGIARFDGKYFQVFTTAQGLPDNEVLEMVKEKNGRIWINCFKQSPAYFDEERNRFINAREDSNLARVSGTANMFLFSLPDGGVLYRNEMKSYVFRDNKLTEYNDLFIREEPGSSAIVLNRLRTSFSVSWIRNLAGEKPINSILLPNTSAGNLLYFGVNESKLYVMNKTTRKGFIYADFNLHPFRFRTDSITIPESFFNFKFTPTSFYLLTDSGKTVVFDKHSLQLQEVIRGNYLPNGFYNDSRGNRWVCTIDKGLLMYRKNPVTAIPLPADYNKSNFLSIARRQDGSLLAGNYYGEVVETSPGRFIVHTLVRKIPSRVRKIVVAGSNVFTIMDGGEGILVNYTKAIIDNATQLPGAGGKTAILCNDSIILVGASTGLLRLNSITQRQVVTFRYKRVSALAKANDSIVYIGSTDGLYKYNYTRNIFMPLTANHPLFRERVMGLCTSPDGLVWVATSGNGILVVRNDKLLFHLTVKNGIVSNACRSITTGKTGQVWLGTSQGISIINYALQRNEPQFSTRNLSMNDGLTSNEINEMLYSNDTVYAATGNGISVIPIAIALPKFNIPVRLIQIRINQRDTVIRSDYELGYTQQNIQMQFAGIELEGHFRNLQYTLDDNNNWTDLPENTLTLQLGSGKHFIQVRAVDVNGNTSDKFLTIRVTIATPFWKSPWFWIIIAVLVQLAVIYLVNRWQKKRKEAKLAREITGVQTAALEQQAFTSLMNPHFLFNALNSIQHYINVQDRQNANRYLSDFASLIRKNFEAAQQSFIPLEQELENIKLYLRLEQMRFNDRFSYRITIDDKLDIEDWMIPTMVMQPFLENALLHGIMLSSIKGELTVDLTEQENNLVITIADNGIGMANSRALKENIQHKSRGMELIDKRMTALARFGTEPVTIRISPASGDLKNPGNKIILCIPPGLYQAWLKAQQ